MGEIGVVKGMSMIVKLSQQRCSSRNMRKLFCGRQFDIPRKQSIPSSFSKKAKLALANAGSVGQSVGLN